MKERLRAVVVGTGVIGAVRATAIRAAGGELAGTVASIPGRGGPAAEERDVPGRYPDFVGTGRADQVLQAC